MKSTSFITLLAIASAAFTAAAPTNINLPVNLES
jgi:hypothetical protein